MLPAMRSLVMSLLSRDLLVNHIRCLQCLNLVNNYIHEYSIYTAPMLEHINTCLFSFFSAFPFI